jgi:hypothetical protein
MRAAPSQQKESVMPAKKTFPSIRVRGAAQFDGALSKRGQPVPAFKEYAALLTQNDEGAPIATVIVNTLGGEIIWTRTGEGNYVGTLAGAFTLNKTLILAAPPTAAFQVNAYTSGSDSIGVDTADAGGDFIDGLLQGYAIDIRVY